MRKSIALACGVALVCAAVVLAVEVEVMSRAEMEAQHYGRLWAEAKAAHVHTASNGVKTWRCCRSCAANTVPMLHEAFEGDKLDPPAFVGPPPAFAETDAHASGHASGHAHAHGAAKAHAHVKAHDKSHSLSAVHTRGSAAHYGASAKEREFAIMQRRKALAQADALAGRRVDSTAYSCCNMCPDLMYPFPGTWNRPSPYSYAPARRFPRSFVETAAKARSAARADANANSRAAAEDTTEVSAEGARYVPTNPHNLPAYYYFESVLKAAEARSRAAREGKWDMPIRPGAAPVWHPPPPPHDDIYRMSRAPNLHDGHDLATPPFLPPCCDYCMSTYFPHIINDEWQLPKKEPYTIGPFSKAFVETGATANANADAQLTANSGAKGKAKGKAKAKAPWSPNDRSNALSAADAAARFLPGAHSDAAGCCHKCVRKDIEDTDWKIYANPEPNPHHHHHHKP